VGSGKFGLAVNFRLRTRNIGKKGIQLENTLRTGIEFIDFTQILSAEVYTQPTGLLFPGLITPFSQAFNKNF
jgi:hypothetical protein